MYFTINSEIVPGCFRIDQNDFIHKNTHSHTKLYLLIFWMDERAQCMLYVCWLSNDFHPSILNWKSGISWKQYHLYVPAPSYMVTIHRKTMWYGENEPPMFHELPVYGVLRKSNMFTWYFACEQFWRVANQQPNWKFNTRKFSMSFNWTLNLGLFLWFLQVCILCVWKSFRLWICAFRIFS